MAREEGEKLQHSISGAKTMLIALLAASAAVGVAMAYFITHSILVPLRQSVEAATVIAGGDLPQSHHSAYRDELGDLLRAIGKMQVALHGVVGQVRH